MIYTNEDILNKRIVVWDIETTGLHYDKDNEKRDRIIQIAGVEVIDGEITSFYEQKFSPTYIDKNGKKVLKDVGSSFEVHKISMDMLVNQPELPEKIDDFLNFIKGSALIAHNGNMFDVPFTNKELSDMGKNIKLNEVAEEIQDTLFLARCFEASAKKQSLDKIVERHSNPQLFKKIKIKNWLNPNEEREIDLAERKERHDALVDCALLAELYIYLLKEKKWDYSLLKDFKEKVKKKDFEEIIVPQDYIPVQPLIFEEEKSKNLDYLNKLSEELTKAKRKSDPNFQGEEMAKMKKEMIELGLIVENNKKTFKI